MSQTIRLRLPDPLPSRKDEFMSYITAAHERLAAFARTQSWESYLLESFILEARIFPTKEQFDKAIVEFFNLDPEVSLHPTHCAALEEKILFIVVPELYGEVYPQGIEPDSYIKLITHEMAHRLHIRLLDGDEEAMGPVWFYEGLATVIAGQFSTLELDLSIEACRSILRDDERGDYRAYNAIMKKVMRTILLADLIARAKDPSFSEWVSERLT